MMFCQLTGFAVCSAPYRHGYAKTASGVRVCVRRIVGDRGRGRRGGGGGGGGRGAVRGGGGAVTGDGRGTWRRGYDVLTYRRRRCRHRV